MTDNQLRALEKIVPLFEAGDGREFTYIGEPDTFTEQLQPYWYVWDDAGEGEWKGILTEDVPAEVIRDLHPLKPRVKCPLPDCQLCKD